MAMTRRRFLRGALALAVALCCTSRRWVQAARARIHECGVRSAECEVIYAARARIYPGPVAPLDPARVREPGKWAG